MATIVAVQSGNWSDTSGTSPWPGGTKPSAGDTVQTGETVIEIDEDITVALLEAIFDGYFTVSAIAGDGTRTINAALVANGRQSALLISNPTGVVVWNSGDITAVTASAIVNTGTMGNITGDITAGSMVSAYGVENQGTIGDVTGDITAGSNDSTYGIYNTGAMGDVIGDVAGGSGNYASGIYNEGTMGDVTGDITGGSGILAAGIFSFSADSCDIDGLLTCGPTGVTPVMGAMRLVRRSTNAMTFIDTTDSALTLSNDYPAVEDVKDGVIYNRGTQEGEYAGVGVGPVSITINITGAGCS